ncbi:MAG: cytidine deaminase [Deltaproteobacteria bacterium CG07_land_8_20_14_0_80_38_7]|nr:MAG: cytidine deaminase [Deltaproteobacteria bacterium CG07_land_8_20_14_0_80_38_7]
MTKKILTKDFKKLFNVAKQVRKLAYAPYSGIKVGSALESIDGKIYTGCNIENTSFAAICSERVALYKAISDGARKFKRIVVVADLKTITSPCGVCRQALIEFSPDMEVFMCNLKGKVEVATVAELLPYIVDYA